MVIPKVFYIFTSKPNSLFSLLFNLVFDTVHTIYFCFCFLGGGFNFRLDRKLTDILSSAILASVKLMNDMFIRSDP